MTFVTFFRQRDINCRVVPARHGPEADVPSDPHHVDLIRHLVHRVQRVALLAAASLIGLLQPGLSLHRAHGAALCPDRPHRIHLLHLGRGHREVLERVPPAHDPG